MQPNNTPKPYALRAQLLEHFKAYGARLQGGIVRFNKPELTSADLERIYSMPAAREAVTVKRSGRGLVVIIRT